MKIYGTWIFLGCQMHTGIKNQYQLDWWYNNSHSCPNTASSIRGIYKTYSLTLMLWNTYILIVTQLDHGRRWIHKYLLYRTCARHTLWRWWYGTHTEISEWHNLIRGGDEAISLLCSTCPQNKTRSRELWPYLKTIVLSYVTYGYLFCYCNHREKKHGWQW